MLDEPTNRLDPGGIRWLRGYLAELADSGRTVLISSHVLAAAGLTGAVMPSKEDTGG